MGPDAVISMPKPALPGLPVSGVSSSSAVPMPSMASSDPLASRLSGLMGGEQKDANKVSSDSSDSSSDDEAPVAVANSKPVDEDVDMVDPDEAEASGDGDDANPEGRKRSHSRQFNKLMLMSM